MQLSVFYQENRQKQSIYSVLLQKKRSKSVTLKKQNSIYIHCGGDSIEDPPVPIPNTEVKLNYAESTLPATAREDK